MNFPEIPDLPGIVAASMLRRAIFVFCAAHLVLWVTATRWDLESLVALTLAALVSAYDFVMFVRSSNAAVKDEDQARDESGRVSLASLFLIAVLGLAFVRNPQPEFYVQFETAAAVAALEHA